jgi:hypothetical protein
MADAVRPYVIRQGDYLVQLAARFGFDADTVWNRAENDPLRAAGRSPNVLWPSDVLYIPDDDPPSVPLAIGASNSFTASVTKVPVTLSFHDETGAPLATADCTYHGLDAEPSDAPLQTNDSGSLMLLLPVDQAPFIIELPSLGMFFKILVGHLDPHTSRSGALQRLHNLGYGGRSYFGPDVEPDADDGLQEQRDERFKRLLQSFQYDRGIPETGELDATTIDALKEAHGS